MILKFKESKMAKYHFIGIGGIGMSGLARLALSNNIRVSGSDLVSTSVTEDLIQQGANIFIGHASANIQPDMTIIYSTDIKKDNPEYQAALLLKCPMLHRSEFLQKLIEKRKSIAVAGTHGKTTTSSLLTWVLECCGQSPGYAIGGIIPQLSSNSNPGKSSYFVAEACESDGTFLNYKPYGAIVTNIDFDHMDFYGTEQALIGTFNTFINQVVSDKHLFWCGDDLHLQQMQPKGISYGFGENCNLKIKDFKQVEWKSIFTASFNGKLYNNIEVALSGKHNALNALAVFGLAISFGLEENVIKQALSTFGGVLRRCEKKGEMYGITFIDDYAHHPTEIKATLKAIKKAIGGRRLIVAYQPHRYTRTHDCKGLYGGIFDAADALFITEIYAAHEAPIPGVSHEIILTEVVKTFKHLCRYVSRTNAASELSAYLRPHDVLVTLGAGDITKLSIEIMEQFKLRGPTKLKMGLIFGGRSVEHEISMISSANIHAALNLAYYAIEQFGITRQGKWKYGENARSELNLEMAAEDNKVMPDFDLELLSIGAEHSQKVKSVSSGSNYGSKDCVNLLSSAAVSKLNIGNPLEKASSTISAEVLSKLLDCDVLFPVLHGTYGEDGTIQGLFDLFSKAYVGCDHRSSAICMDKVLSKRLALEAGLPTLPYITFSKSEWENSQEEIINRVNKELIFPVFVKPIHLGSSIGVHKVSNLRLLAEAIYSSFQFDSSVLVENGIENVREIEFSLLGNDDITVFPPGEVYAGGAIHDYDSKYGLNPQRAAALFDAQAKLPKIQIEEGMRLAANIYKTLGCTGMARVDTFLDPQGRFWFNEINPIPGFTKLSLFPIMCEANGLPLSELLDRLIILGLQRRRSLDRLEVTL
jgi:UDP-N-acetylmuramate--alanine ligase